LGTRLSEVAVVDVRESLTRQRDRLLSLLISLSEAQWAAPTAAPGWSVKDIALALAEPLLRVRGIIV
jgi:Mycothiol maleylpyruvate isomerase N-terminal domain